MISWLWRHENIELSLFAVAALTVQFALITSCDDVAKFNEEDLAAYDLYPNFGIVRRIAWSKTVREERPAASVDGGNGFPVLCAVEPWPMDGVQP